MREVAGSAGVSPASSGAPSMSNSLEVKVLYLA
jgi:hypothetical protein